MLFRSGTNGINGSIYWQGVEYLPFPIQSSGFETKGDGSLPRPKLAISNQDFFVSNLIRRYNNLVGAKIVRKRTFVKFLDNVNFSESKNPYGSADSTAGLEDQVFFILRRSAETRTIVEFELASPLELDNVTFPKRSVMARYCGFHYRGNGCRYAGPPIADENDSRIRKAVDFKNGLLRRYYTNTAPGYPSDSNGMTALIQAGTFSTETIVSTTTVENADNIAFEFIGYLKIDVDEAGVYEFGVDPDDSGELFINGSIVASFYGGRGQAGSPTGTTTSVVPLSAGYHRILIRLQEYGGGQGITLFYKPPPSTTSSWTPVPSSKFYYDPAEQGILTSSQRFYSTSQLSAWVSLGKNALMDGANRGKWVAGTTYKTGEFVYIENNNIKVSKKDINSSPNWMPLPKFYVCAKTHVSSGAKNPSFNKEYWVCDQCSKTLTGCRLRFGSDDYLPFGGFPGTEEYSISAQ